MTDLTAIFALSDRYIDEAAQLDPCLATSLGVAGHETQLTDFSPDGCAARAALDRRCLHTLSSLEPSNEADRLAKDVMTERLQVGLDAFDAGEWERTLNIMYAPSNIVRGTFDLMSRSGEQAWADIAARLAAVPACLQGIAATLDAGRRSGRLAARRQALAVAAQSQTWADNRWFDSLVHEAKAQQGLPEAALSDLEQGAALANEAYASFAGYLRDQYAADASENDGVGLERYRLAARNSLGADLDPDEMYDWAWEDFASLRAQIVQTCERVRPGASFAEVLDLLETDPAWAVQGADAYRAWLQELTDAAIERSLAYFDIPEPMRRCEVHLAPEGSGAAAYYTSPSEDFSRPGGTWWPTLGRTHFPIWGEVTTCYHESVPGHHLQLAYAIHQADTLSRYQRNAFLSGHGEGWALYAERLCDELGWFDDPAHRLGFLCGQMLRSVRVIIDIGMHLGARIPAGTTLIDGTPFHGGEVWTPDLAYQFALSETGSPPAFVASEIDRYLGWPAQAISYKIGEREWLRARADAQARLGSSFDLKAFHMFALGLGVVGLAALRTELARFTS